MRRLLFLFCLFLTACAPQAEPARTQVQQLPTSVSFYPREAGTTWQYLREGERVDANPLVTQVQGPTVVDGVPFIAWRTAGRGIDLTSYRQYREDGVFLFRRHGPGYILTFNPPLQELPPAGGLSVGASWGGESQATVTYTQATAAPSVTRVRYRFNIVDRRPVTVQGGAFEVFVIIFESQGLDAQGNVVETLRRETWFTPYVGEIRNDLDYFLSASNFRLGNR